jgi:NADPH2:quinone reductase
MIQTGPQIVGEVMGEMFVLLAAGVLGPGQPTIHELAEGPKALADLEGTGDRGQAGAAALSRSSRRAADPPVF